MRCSESQTICTADNALAAREAAAQFEGLLFAQVLQPLQKALGPLGDIAASRIGTEIARRHSGGLSDTLLALIEAEQ